MKRREAVNKELGIDNMYFDEQRDRALDMGLIEAGLRIAGGTSANPLANISEGAIPALEQYNKQIAAADAGTRAELINARDAFIEEQSEIRKMQSDLLNDYFAAQAAAANAQGGLAKEAFDATIKYLGYYIPEASIRTFFDKYPREAAALFQDINSVVIDAFKENRAVDQSEIDRIMLDIQKYIKKDKK